MAELKPVYKAPTKDLAEVNLEKLAQKWSKKYPVVIKSWQDNWHKLSTYFKYTEDIKRIIHTTNTIEGFHRRVRKVTKNALSTMFKYQCIGSLSPIDLLNNKCF